MNILTHTVRPFRHMGVLIGACIWLNRDPYFTAEAIGEWLGYADPQDAVRKILSRNAFIKGFSKKIRVKSQEAQGFSPGDRLSASEKERYSRKTRVVKQIRGEFNLANWAAQ